jgi:hypothetical protein
VSEIGSDSAAIEKLLMPGKSHGDAEMDIDLVGKSLVLIPIAMSAAVSWLEDANLFRTLDARVKAQIRGAFRCQLHEVCPILVSLFISSLS